MQPDTEQIQKMETYAPTESKHSSHPFSVPSIRKPPILEPNEEGDEGLDISKSKSNTK